jgi:hypothetical protein
MANVQEIKRHIRKFLDDQISLEDFDDWSAEYAWNIHKRDDHKTQDLARSLRAIINAHEDDTDESGLRKELEIAIHPFVRR